MILKIVKRCAIAALLFVAYLAIDIVYYSGKRQLVSSDAAIILGAGIRGDKPSPVFKERINHGVNLYKTGKVRCLIFTGGYAPGKALAESEVARKYALQQGVAATDIFIETVSKVTYENIQEAKKLMQNQQLKHVLLVSDPLHMRRAMLMAKDLGLDAKTSPTPSTQYKTWSSKRGFLLREMYFYAIYLFRRML